MLREAKRPGAVFVIASHVLGGHGHVFFGGTPPPQQKPNVVFCYMSFTSTKQGVPTPRKTEPQIWVSFRNYCSGSEGMNLNPSKWWFPSRRQRPGIIPTSSPPIAPKSGASCTPGSRASERASQRARETRPGRWLCSLQGWSFFLVVQQKSLI